MKVSTRAEYGFRALVELSAHYGEGPLQTHTIAERQGLPEPYLNQLMATLRHAGLVTSKRGPAGGHTLSRAPSEITLREAFAVLEGSTAPWWCVEVDDPDCAYVDGCGLRPVWRALQAAAEGILDRLTLADLRPSPAAPSGARRGSAGPRGAGGTRPARRPPERQTQAPR